jgi:hypothetical protein
MEAAKEEVVATSALWLPEPHGAGNPGVTKINTKFFHVGVKRTYTRLKVLLACFDKAFRSVYTRGGSDLLEFIGSWEHFAWLCQTLDVAIFHALPLPWLPLFRSCLAAYPPGNANWSCF